MAAKQRKNPTKDRYLAITITPEDIAWGEAQNSGRCAIVRAIQREVPDAVRVIANTKNIAFSLERDDYRYTFDTPEEAIENIIKPFDLGLPVTPGTSFSLVNPTSAEPRQHRDAATRQTHRQNQRLNRRTTSTKNVKVSSINRFKDVEAAE